jgi:hypothetical protein
MWIWCRMPHEAEIEKKEKGFFAHVLTWTAGVFVAVALYVLSAGPAEKLAYMNDKKGFPVLLVFYAPLIWANDNVPFVNRFFGWYMKFWHIEE